MFSFWVWVPVLYLKVAGRRTKQVLHTISVANSVLLNIHIANITAQGGRMVLSGIPGMSGNWAHVQTVDTRPFPPIFWTGLGMKLQSSFHHQHAPSFVPFLSTTTHPIPTLPGHQRLAPIHLCTGTCHRVNSNFDLHGGSRYVCRKSHWRPRITNHTKCMLTLQMTSWPKAHRLWSSKCA